ncbi:MAG: protein translocase subunit SecF [Waddliaceae bacterium]
MEKQKRWQFFLIMAVIILTLINILPTVFFYTKSLNKPIDKQRAEAVGLQIIDRVNSLEEDGKAWLYSFSRNLGIQPVRVELQGDDLGLFEVGFKNAHDADIFRRFLPRAGVLIPFVPAQLELYGEGGGNEKVVLVSRQINVQLDPLEAGRYFDFYPKYLDGKISPEYQEHVYDRTVQLALAFAGPSRAGRQLAALTKNASDASYRDTVIALAKDIVDMKEAFGENSPITQRFFARFTQVDVPDADKGRLIRQFLARIDNIKAELEKQKTPLEQEKKAQAKDRRFIDPSTEQRLSFIRNQYESLESAGEIIRSNLSAFKAGKQPLTVDEIRESLKKSEAFIDPKDPLQVLAFGERNPFVEGLAIDWTNDQIALAFYEDVQSIRLSLGKAEEAAYLREKLNQYIFNDITRVSRESDETISQEGNEFAVALTKLTNAEGFLSFNLGYLAEKQSREILMELLSDWLPEHADFDRQVFPVVPYEVFKQLTPREQKLGLVVYAPARYADEPPQGFSRTSIYVIARGLEDIVQKYRETPQASGREFLDADIQSLNALLQRNGFIAYPGSSFGIDPAFSQDRIYELDDYYTTLLNATREDFYVKGSKRSAVLDFSDVEQRIITTNKIDDRIQEDLVKWRDDYYAAQVDIDPTKRYEVPPPTKNVYWENFKLSLAKYFRGDDRKILRWGLDLSGGKTVRIGLRDQNNQVVTDPDDLKQVVNELYTRINKMGVAERTIRIENQNVILDFPGSQAFSASELIKASAMYFHIVNEQFSSSNPALKEVVDQFLQNVWNEAVVTNRKDVQSINEIAWEHLGGEERDGKPSRPRNEYAKILYENGLRLASPKNTAKSSAFNDTQSSIAILKGEDYTEWGGEAHPLIVIFHNYALEGSSLTNIQVGYDPSEGNILSFGVKRRYEHAHDQEGGSPREDFYTWTSQFAEDKIAGTPREAYSQGRGWQMAVILNDVVITKPNLRAALKDAATISGRFSQREIQQLAADLKAGSLSFTPRILSEQNVSAELGYEERTKGIIAALVGLVFVAIAMISYYRFAGLVATCAVLFNLLIMWGVLQNLGAALTLPGIAGIVLTIGMAVDANVLVFERIREEFKISGRIASAIQAGYRKAFSAIVDSNITTIIAALILIQFDSGPIKGFAVTLIIGLISSMFTALFMTRYFFAGWVRNPKHRSLSMAELIGNTNIDFLRYTRTAFTISLVIMLIGGYFFVSQRQTLFGMDFTGGYSLVVELEEEQTADPQYRRRATESLLSHGAGSTDFEIRELSKPNQLRIQLGLGMEEMGHPFYQLPESYTEGEFTYPYEKDPRIVWVVDALSDAGLNIQQSDLAMLDAHWSMMSGQFSETMRNNALFALGLALLSILIYITFRFEFKFAIGAVIALAHDVVVTMGVYAIFHKLGLPVQIDLEVVGAIMTIIGYSLNDTIVVFDRIREDIKLLRKLTFHDIINHALNMTLSRTLMTSGTTLLVLLSLVLLGGRSIFDFSLVMTIGVVVGTFSSLFIAGPITLYFHKRETEEIALKKA